VWDKREPIRFVCSAGADLQQVSIADRRLTTSRGACLAVPAGSRLEGKEARKACGTGAVDGIGAL